jgi:hypothetical protein
MTLSDYSPGSGIVKIVCVMTCRPKLSPGADRRVGLISLIGLCEAAQDGIITRPPPMDK